LEYTWIDFIIMLIFFLNIALGVIRGLLKEIVSIIAVFIALLVAIKFTVPLNSLLTSLAGFQDVLTSVTHFGKMNAQGPLSLFSFGVSFLILFFPTFFIGEAINYYGALAPLFVVFPLLGLLEKILAGLLGFVRGYIFNLIFILILGLTPVVSSPGWSNSALIPQLMPKANEIGGMVKPGGFPRWS
jgi:membrane protein required for colicin V production